MWKQLRNKRDEDEGFTLIELLVVIIIIGILAAIVVFAIGGTRDDAVASSCKTDAKSIQLSLEAQRTKTGSYPASQGDALNQADGALLRTWPDAGDYTFAYTGGGSTYSVEIAGTSVKGGTFTEAAGDLDTACGEKTTATTTTSTTSTTTP